MSTWLIVTLAVYGYVIGGLIVGRISYKIDREDCGPRQATRIARWVFLFWPLASFAMACYGIELSAKWAWNHLPTGGRVVSTFDRILTGDKSC